jgi:ABC-type Fe3+/spermidine/putrescine transport system ATPase subunit
MLNWVWRLEQFGSAERPYKRPSSRFVADFIGKCNFLEGLVTGERRFGTSGGEALQFAGSHLQDRTPFQLRSRP